MKIHIEKEDIPELASRIPFEQLSDEEQQQIVAVLGSRELYTAMHYAIIQTKHTWRNESKSASRYYTSAPQSLHNALQRKKSRSLLLKPIPLYQVSIAIAASIAIIFFMVQKNDSNGIILKTVPSDTQTVVLHQQYNRDSLISIIADSIRKVLYNTEENKRISAGVPHIRTVKYTEPITVSNKKEYENVVVNNPYGGLDNLPNVLAQNKGVSASESDAVERFVYKQMSMR